MGWDGIPLIFVCSDATLDDFLHFGNGHLIKTARLHSLRASKQVNSINWTDAPPVDLKKTKNSEEIRAVVEIEMSSGTYYEAHPKKNHTEKGEWLTLSVPSKAASLLSLKCLKSVNKQAKWPPPLFSLFCHWLFSLSSSLSVFHSRPQTHTPRFPGQTTLGLMGVGGL